MLTDLKDIDFVSDKELGEGAYSKVFQVFHKRNKKQYALKHVTFTRSTFSRFARTIARI